MFGGSFGPHAAPGLIIAVPIVWMQKKNRRDPVTEMKWCTCRVAALGGGGGWKLGRWAAG